MTSSSPVSPAGRLEPVDIKSSWPREDSDFTPWLANEDSLVLLGDTLGLELELVETEKGVGAFRADIVCKDTADGSFVLIENQLERTDHTHLGQILTYAAGLSAVTIVWIASRFREEHRAALDWLNENTNDKLEFFGLEIELWRIGNSLPAPKFNMVCKPNDWVKGAIRRILDSPEITPTKALQQEFWQYFRDHCDGKGFHFKPTKASPHHWMDMAVGKTGYNIAAIASRWNSSESTYDSWEIRAEFAVSNAETHFAPFDESRQAIEEELGFQLNWHNPEDKKMARAWIGTKANLFDKSSWAEACEWLATHLQTMHQVFGKRIKQI